MTNAFEIGDQGGQVRPQQASLLDPRRQDAAVERATAGTESLVRTMLLNVQRDVAQIDLLDDTGPEAGRPQGGPQSGQRAMR